MQTRALDKGEWQSYFDHCSKVMSTKLVEMEAGGMGFKDNVEAEWLPLQGLSYDPKDDIVFVITPDLEHQIPHPKSIRVSEEGPELVEVELTEADGTRQVVKLKNPMRLPDMH